MSNISEITNHGLNDTRVTTHDKKFHADDVMAIALLDYYCKDGVGVNEQETHVYSNTWIS